MGMQKNINHKYIIGQGQHKGVVAIPLVLQGIPSHQVITLQRESNFEEILGCSMNSPQVILLKEAFKRAYQVLVYTLSCKENGKVSSKAWDIFLETIRCYNWRAMAVPTEEVKVKKKVVDLINDMREIEGRGVYAVLPHYGEANHMGIISIGNGIKLKDGTILNRSECTAWVAGVIASAGVRENEELLIYEDAIQTDKNMNRTQMNKLIEEGNIVFVKRGEKVGVAEDINTFKTFTPKWGEVYHSNAFVRMVDIIKYDLHRMMKIYYLGSIKQGKSMQESKMYFKEICVRYLEMLQSKQVLYEVNPIHDIEVFLAEDMRGVDVSLILKANKTGEKVYVGIGYNRLIG